MLRRHTNDKRMINEERYNTMGTKRRRHFRKKDPFGDLLHHICRETILERHALDNVPTKPGPSLSWLWVLLGCGCVALIIAFPVILGLLLVFGITCAVIAASGA